MAHQYLSKSRYIAGLQCTRRLWLQVNESEEPKPDSPIDFGLEIGRAARRLFPRGALVDEGATRHADAVARTTALMARPDVLTIFEAAFAEDGVRIRVDVLARHSRGWRLIEVKGSAGVKDHYLDDVALQAHVVGAAGVPLSAIEVMHINTGYVRGPGEIDWPALFTRVDVTAEVAARLPAVSAHLVTMRTVLSRPEQPGAEPGNQCGKPYGCGFWDRCTADKPKDWVRNLPRLSAVQAQQLDALGIDAISAIPVDFPLNSRQGVIRDAIARRKGFVAADLGRLLHRFRLPACYLDFEAMMPPIPLYEGTRPFQTLPFQWSLHIANRRGSLAHVDFLAPTDADPRRAFAETLIAALSGPDGPIIVYSPYEQTQLRQLALLFPDLAVEIDAIIDRLADLLPVVRGAVYFPEFGYSNSIKAVAPALSPGFGYADLEDIGDGAAAAAAFAQMASGAISDPEEVARLRAALLAYCERDTLALVEVHRALRGLASAGAG